MTHFLTVDVQKKGETFVFTLHYAKKTTCLEFRSLYDGFTAINSIVEDQKKGIK